MDVSALYPSITVELAYETMLKVIRDSKLPWENIDITTLERFIALTVSRDELDRLKIGDYIPTPKPRTTFNSWVNT